MSYLVTIGLEVHCQVKTRTKMFCACETSFGEEPNTRTCPVCLGLPGALPVLNRHAIEKTLLAGLLLDCGSPEISRWDRKSYFYPDMPKNFQTTQMDFPLCIGGSVPLYDHCYPTDARKNIARPGHKVRLNRIHLEEDVAKSTHLGNSSLIDFNRAGTPLMEIVTEPDLESAEEAGAFLRSLQMILQQGGISDADMEKGQLRCDVNISLRRKESDPLGAKIELKNLNSISAVRRAIQFETARQAVELDIGNPLFQSTWRWDDDRGETQLMRTKEDAHDYRYFPCPDLLPIVTAPILEKVRPMLTERPHERSARYEADFSVSPYDASVLSSDLPLANYFEALAATPGVPGKKAANFLLNTLLGTLNERSVAIVDSPLSPEKTGALLGLVEGGTLALSQAKEVLVVLLDAPDKDPAAVAKELGFEPADAGELDSLCDQVIAANPKQVDEIKAGNEKLLNFLTGQVMKASSSKPNPKQVTEILASKLK
ncbi:Asp-tRNA(Asn)/Glu-tRNA(Gln) amidotransferase subunit GatB [Luteolibacter arcticus]|uniref:Aspartyl/glutamyl-tRNA(Asn/Gln) amidotransferase subunit B n=1 Tax=Luteolibacter arcticus TaxID=1581411 RepID=A0ABT3GC56_9BACT|nr:Asp-tRNA(Asn)/Glu-tRNA(Gln) amidotransferase subunit GatB [Luteolibacter arcticus]MCW1921210.1 Asp-tRNA(Asn)/Glu-tRNA(Gln) amidotransferase subunit GatB [Luteolibacter arcticus]